MADIDRVLRSNLKLRHLQLLVVLDQFRHLGRAAEFLSLTQPAVSKTLAEIERLFGVSLFDRSTRGTEPTPYGAAVVRFARSVLADYERTRDELAAVAAGATGRVRVGAMVVATHWLAHGGAGVQAATTADRRAGGRRRPDAPAAAPARGRAGPDRRPARTRPCRARPGHRGAVRRADGAGHRTRRRAGPAAQAGLGRRGGAALRAAAALCVPAHQARPAVPPPRPEPAGRPGGNRVLPGPGDLHPRPPGGGRDGTDGGAGLRRAGPAAGACRWRWTWTCRRWASSRCAGAVPTRGPSASWPVRAAPRHTAAASRYGSAEGL
jgi:hypothetical protein